MRLHLQLFLLLFTQATIDTFSDESDDDYLAVITKDDDDVRIRLNVESLEMCIYRLIVANNLETVFPNTVIVFRIYLSLMISSCSGERSFSKLKLIKSQLRSCMAQKRLNIALLFSTLKTTFCVTLTCRH
jgi:hypothetical protein